MTECDLVCVDRDGLEVAFVDGAFCFSLSRLEKKAGNEANDVKKDETCTLVLRTWAAGDVAGCGAVLDPAWPARDLGQP